LAQYDQIVSNGAERILRLAESQVAHRHAQERALLGAEIAAGEAAAQLRWRGQSFAFAIGLATLAASLAAALSGHDSVAVALAVGSLVGAAAAFLGLRLVAFGSRKEGGA
jgi:uncharacterized membrane protein